MKVVLIYPSDHRIPHSLYLSLPELAASLEQAGHQVVLKDLNAEILRKLLNRNRLAGYRHYMENTLSEFARKSVLAPGETIIKHSIETCLQLPLDMALQGQEAAETLYDPERFYDPQEYRLALDRLSASLGFLFGSIVGPSPYLKNYLPLMGEMLAAEMDDPVTQALREGLLDEILAEEPGLVGITMPYQEHIFEGLRLAALLRRADRHLPIAIGGPQVTKYREEMFAGPELFDFIDYAVMNEGNTAIVELCEALEAKRSRADVRNLYWRDGGTVRFNGPGPNEVMEKLPTPSYAAADVHCHLKPEPLFGLMTTRGCAYKICVFCSEAFHNNFAMQSARHVFRDVKNLVERHGAKNIFFWDSLMPPRTMWELADMIAAEGLDVRWFVNTKFYDLFARPDQVKRLADGGLRSIHFGMESGNQRILDLMRKGTKIDRVPAMLRTLNDHGVMTQVSWFGGFPTESQDEFFDTIRFLERNRQNLDLNVFVGSYYFEFGTYVSEHPEEFDGEVVDIGGDYTLKVGSGMQPEEVARWRQKYLPMSDMDLLCHGGYFLYHVNRGISPREISRTRGRSLLEPEMLPATAQAV